MSSPNEPPQHRLQYHKWDYITLADFRSKSSWNWISYAWLWFLAVVSVSVYASDTFTAVNLLAFDDWSNGIKPQIPFTISKWIFAGCILFSWVLCIYEWIRAVRVMRRGNVAESYLDPLAVVLQSMRLGGVGKGWRRFLVFTALTKSKKGADYVALFSYFQFKGAIRIILAEGPRQAINAITLYSVMQANLIPDNDGGLSAVEQFFKNVEFLAQHQEEQAIIIGSMLFTLIIWVFSALSLLAACLLYIGFLWHYIPRDDGSLSKYCRRKVNTRLERIINANAKDAIAKEELKRRKTEEKLMNQSDVSIPKPVKQPTLPLVAGDDFDPKPTMSQSSNGSTSPPPYSWPTAEQEDDQEPTLPKLSDPIEPPPKLFRTDSESTQASNVSYGPQPTLPQVPPPLGQGHPAPVRMGTKSTVASNVSYGPRPPPSQIPDGRRPPPRPLRMGSSSTVASNVSYGPPVRAPEQYAPVATAQQPGRPPPPGRSYTQSSGFSNSSNSSNRPLLYGNNREPRPGEISRTGTPQYLPQGESYEMSAPRSATASPQQYQPWSAPRGGYRPYSPANGPQMQNEN